MCPGIVRFASIAVTPTIVLTLVLTLAGPASAQFTISGTVTDSVFVPIAGVDIRLFDDLGTPIGIPPTVTDTLGFYGISGVPPGTYGVGFEPAAATKLLPRLETVLVVASHVTLDVSLDPGHLLSGFVRDTTGVGIFNIDLNVEDDKTGIKLNTPGDNTDSTGFYDVVLPTGELNLRWRSVGIGADPWIAVELRRVPITADTTIDVTMILGVFVSGTVKDQSLSPVVNANLDFIETATGVKVDAPGDNTDSTGTYLVHIPRASYDVRVKPRVTSRLLAAEIPAVPIDNDTTVSFVLAPGLSLSGTVRNSGGVGVLGVDIDVEDAVVGTKLLTPFDVTDSLGHYEVIIPSGLFNIAFQPPVSSLLAPVEFAAVSVTGDTIVDATVPNGIVLSGMVQGGGGLGVPGVDIDAKVTATGASIPLVGDQTDADGAFAVVIAPGTYDLEIEPPRTTRLVAKRLPAIPLVQNTSITVPLGPGVLVSGAVTDSVGNPFGNLNVDAIVTSSGTEIFTPGDHTNALGHYELVVPVDTYTLLYKPSAASGVADSVMLENVVVVGDTVINVEFATTIVTGIVDRRDAVPPGAARLHQNYPNPFNPGTRIRFTVHRPTHVNLTVYDVSGRPVTTLVDRVMRPGTFSVRWDGRNGRGRAVASGVYFCRLTAGRSTQTRKAVLLK